MFVPLYQEAKGLIQALQLKKRHIVKGVDSFVSDEVVLSLIGVGKLSAVYSIASVLAAVIIQREDYALAFGSAMGCGVDDGLYIANCIEDEDSKRVYYPDMLYDLGIEECKVKTGSVVKEAYEDFIGLYDMESSGIYYACNKYFGPHAITILRFVSDHGEWINSETLTTSANAYTDKVVRIIQGFIRPTKETMIHPDYDKLLSHLHLTQTQTHQLENYLRYATLANIDLTDVVEKILHNDINESKDRKEALDAIYQKCIGEGF